MSKASRRRARARRIRNNAQINNPATVTADQAAAMTAQQNNTDSMNP